MIPLNELAPQISLDGSWDFRLGDQDSWNEIHVPGTWEAQGYDRRLEGPAYYRRQVTVPNEWAGSRIVLEFGAVSYVCRATVNNVFVGDHIGLWTPFAFDVTAAINPGQLNLIEVEVYKPSHLPEARYPFRKSLVGFIADVATTFGGLWQEISLRAYQACFEDIQLIADTGTQEIICSFRTWVASNQNLEPVEIDISVSLNGNQVGCYTVTCNIFSNQEVRCKVLQPVLWSPENPVLYNVDLCLRRGDRAFASFHRRIGFRRLSTRGEVLLFNDYPVLLRGILHWGWMPEQIAPYFSLDFARTQIREVKRLGFNLIKLCLFVPNPVLYEIADEEGIFLWQEWPMWLPQIDSDNAAHAPVEYGEYMALAHSHPSIVIYSAGCELDETVGPDLLGRLNNIMRQGMSGTLFCDNSGTGEAYGGLQVDFADFADYHTYSDLEFFEQMLDHWRRDWKPPRPLIFGEFCDSDTYRDPEKLRALSDDHANSDGFLPWWLTTDNPVMDWRTETHPVLHQEESIAAAGLDLTHQQLQKISYADSLAIRKYVLETIRRRAGIGGYVITGLRDTPISTSGIFDDFGHAKWNTDQFLPFNGECTLCLDGERRRRWQNGGDRVERFDLQNEWAEEFVHRRIIFSGPCVNYQGLAEMTWQLRDVSGRVFAEKEQQIEVDLKGIRPREIASLTFQLPLISMPQELCLEVKFSSPTIRAQNSWSFWIYPKHQRTAEQTNILVLYDPSFLLTEFEELFALQRLDVSSLSSNSIVIASALPRWAEDFLKSGGKMILLQWEDGPLPVQRRPFWREAIRIFARHPLWDTFGVGGNLRFLGISSDVSFDIARLQQVMPALDEARPIFRRLDGRDFRVSEFLLEARIGRGVLLACSLRLAGGHGRQPSGLHRNVAGQALLWTMIDYLEKESR